MAFVILGSGFDLRKKLAFNTQRDPTSSTNTV
jgi:hypothetical protein